MEIQINKQRSGCFDVLTAMLIYENHQQDVTSVRCASTLADVYHWWELPQVSFLSRQTRVCRDKTRLLSRQKYACRDKHVRAKYNLLAPDKHNRRGRKLNKIIMT